MPVSRMKYIHINVLVTYVFIIICAKFFKIKLIKNNVAASWSAPLETLYRVLAQKILCIQSNLKEPSGSPTAAAGSPVDSEPINTQPPPPATYLSPSLEFYLLGQSAS